ncbi:hypothetical protein HPB50_006194 [Hyalomma asiaticum]|uniref:Uncharacterized protein n=1 Tax=Hyalomma asiaticum TaxID=266040 RepID=A0ACB7RRE9_HYAAI|nr:hypothetical protein HPB50_006194 [Hyalomma asiaticum]
MRATPSGAQLGKFILMCTAASGEQPGKFTLMLVPPLGTQPPVGLPRRHTPVKASPRFEPLVEKAPVGRISLQSNYSAPEAEPRATVRPLSKRRLGDEPAASTPLTPSGWASALRPRSGWHHSQWPTAKAPHSRWSYQVAQQRALASCWLPANKTFIASSQSGSSTVFQRLGPSAEEPESDPPRTVLTTKRQLPAPYQAVLAAAAKPSRIISLTSSAAKTARPTMRRQVLPPTASSRASLSISDSSGGAGGVMLRRSLTEATSGRLGGSQGRFANLAGASSQRLAAARDRVGPKFVKTAGVVQTTVRTTVSTTRKGSTAVPTAKRVTLVAPRVGFSGSTAAPQSVFARLGTNR